MDISYEMSKNTVFLLGHFLHNVQSNDIVFSVMDVSNRRQIGMLQNSAEASKGVQKTILVVEDNAAIGNMLVASISLLSPYRVVWVSNATQALEAVSCVMPQLLLIDYLLPDMSGIALYDRLHTDKGLETPPVILMSAALTLPMNELVMRKLASIEKPFHLRELIDQMQALVC